MAHSPALHRGFTARMCVTSPVGSGVTSGYAPTALARFGYVQQPGRLQVRTPDLLGKRARGCARMGASAHVVYHRSVD